MVKTNKYVRRQRSSSNKVKYCSENVKNQLMITTKYVRCQKLYSTIGQYDRDKGKKEEQMR